MLSTDVEIVNGFTVSPRLGRGVDLTIDVGVTEYEVLGGSAWQSLDENDTRRLLDVLQEALA